jgi:hypothetical protein
MPKNLSSTNRNHKIAPLRRNNGDAFSQHAEDDDKAFVE